MTILSSKPLKMSKKMQLVTSFFSSTMPGIVNNFNNSTNDGLGDKNDNSDSTEVVAIEAIFS